MFKFPSRFLFNNHPPISTFKSFTSPTVAGVCFLTTAKVRNLLDLSPISSELCVLCSVYTVDMLMAVLLSTCDTVECGKCANTRHRSHACYSRSSAVVTRVVLLFWQKDGRRWWREKCHHSVHMCFTVYNCAFNDREDVFFKQAHRIMCRFMVLSTSISFI